MVTYAETIDYLFRQLPMYQRVGGIAYKADLRGTESLMELLEHPHKKFRSIHVAGTNGKGSVSSLLASVLKESGLKVGLYTSPHLVDFRERIRVNGIMIPEGQVVDFVLNYRDRFEPLELSFFEWSVGLAFHHFAIEEVDVAVIEVGMGGRLDSTNVITPELSVITNISLDHSQYLGDTLARIAREKAGIIKKGVPVVVGRTHRETEGVFRGMALALDAPIVFSDQLFPKESPKCPMMGPYHHENAQTAMIAIDELKQMGWDIDDNCVAAGFANVIGNTGLRGRWELLSRTPEILADVAHNRDAFEVVLPRLATIRKWTEVHFVIGFVSDKEVGELLAIFPKDAHYYLCQPSVPRAMPVDRLCRLADQCNLRYQSYDAVSKALAAATKAALDTDLIYVGGSTFVVADALCLPEFGDKV